MKRGKHASALGHGQAGRFSEVVSSSDHDIRVIPIILLARIFTARYRRALDILRHAGKATMQG